MKTFLTIFLMCIACVPQAFPQDNSKIGEVKNSALFHSEELTYEVSWWAFDLGTLKMSMHHSGNSDSSFLAVCYIDSYDGLPFADIHSIFKTTMDNNAVSKSFTALDKEAKDKWVVTRYVYDAAKSTAVVQKGGVREPSEPAITPTFVDTISINPLTQDGLSLFYFARRQVKSLDTITVKAIVTEKAGSATMNFYGKETEIEIDAVDYPVSVVEFDGRADFKGIFGLTGEFKGWFSNDDARVPIKAKVGVILGNVTMELIGWKRTGWIPPKRMKKNYVGE